MAQPRRDGRQCRPQTEPSAVDRRRGATTLTFRGSRDRPPPLRLDGEPSDLGDRADTRVLIPPTAGAPARPPSDIVWAFDGEVLGTTWSVRAVAPPGSDKAALSAAVQVELDAVEAVVSLEDAASEVSRLNTAPPGSWALSAAFWSLLDAAMDLADATDGAVDPTLGALLDLWSAGPEGARRDGDPAPSDETIETAVTLCGWRGLRLNPEDRAAIQPGGLRLDFSALAAGHAVDRVSDRLTALGAASHLVAIGDVRLGRGVKPDAQPWWVEVSQPDGSPAPRTVAALLDLAVASIGDHRRQRPTLDGRTGRPADDRLATVTVFHASALQADAYATALAVMGPVEGPAFAEASGLAAQFVGRTPRGLIERLTPAWAAMMSDG